LRHLLDPGAWFGIGVLGALLFLIGIYIPALANFPDSAALRLLFAIAGGALGMLGFSFWWEGRAEPPRRRGPRTVAGGPPNHPFGPSFEVYRPPQREDGPLLRREPPTRE
ncbi:MAG: DUF2254 domain-containing protein, partial [Thermoplasmata archaeon]|nr:DUF2254 domain-containing protein [Thermoplasmata archaeon]